MLTTLILAAALQGAPPGMVQLPNGGYAPCSHPLAIGLPECGVPAVPPPSLPPECRGVNPYTDPEAGLRCAGEPLRRPFRVGRVYVRIDGAGGPSRVFVSGRGEDLAGAPLVFALCLERCVRAYQVEALAVGFTGRDWQEEGR